MQFDSRDSSNGGIVGYPCFNQRGRDTLFHQTGGTNQDFGREWVGMFSRYLLTG